MKKIAIVLSLLFISLFSFSQISFEEKIVIDSSEGIRGGVRVADIDGDGNEDIIINSSDGLTWYKRLIENENEFFGAKHIINSIQVSYLKPIDIDNDGDIDLVTNINGLSWYKNDGFGNFTYHHILSLSLIKVIHFTDVDNDGDLDLIVFRQNSSGTTSGKIFLYFNTNGLGNFGAQNIIEDNYFDQIVSISSGDFDNDGDIDIVTASKTNSGRLSWYKNLDGNGNFDVRTTISAVTHDLKTVIVGDINNDGLVDIFTNDFIGGLYWYENNGNNFIKRTITTGGGTYSTKLIDVDNDGDLDLLSNGNSRTFCYFNDGNGTFSRVTIHNDAYSLGTIDINQDEIPEIISSLNTFLHIMKYDFASSNPSIEYIKVIKPRVEGAINIKTADIDGDGDLDIISSDENKNGLFWFENIDRKGDFIPRLINTYRSKEFVLDDIDNDGDLDIFYDVNVLVNGKRVYHISENDGSGNFEIVDDLLTESSTIFKFPIFSDIDNDGDKDLVFITNKIYWFEKTNGIFGTPQILFDFNVSSLDISDIDNDGDKDLLVTKSFNDEVIWLENDGLSNFTQNVVSNNIERIEFAFAYDIDNDGDKDIVAATNFFLERKIVWYENLDGSGNFSTENIIDILDDSFSFMKILDYDNDGDLDIIMNNDANSSDAVIFWFENTNGLGNFGTKQNIYNIRRSRKIAHSDIDGDGDLDFIVSSIADQPIRWLKNLGNLGNSIIGNTLLDIDLNDCTSNGIPIQNLMVKINNGNDEFAILTNQEGFLLNVNQGDFTTIIVDLPNYFDVNPSSYSHTFTDIGNTEIANFCLQTSQEANDLNISIIPVTEARPGFDANYQIVFKNIGTTQLNGDITLEFDNTRISFLTTSETLTSQTTNSLTFNYTNINPFEIRTIDIKFNVIPPPTVNIDDVLEFSATINPILDDETPDDNIYELNQIVVGSFDPNDIAVAEGEQISINNIDKYLHYIIRFQNTGTAHAIKVRVHSVLDDKLDWTTLKLESFSHDNIVEIKNGNEIDFIFNAIYLPDSTNDEENSHGFIAFKIKPKPNVNVGDIFVENAEIYFDFNTAIATNTVTTEIVNTLTLNDFNTLNFEIYPIPTANILIVNSKSIIKNIHIFNKLGQIVLENNHNNSIDISSLNQGIYYIKIIDEFGKSGNKKIIKK